MVLYVVDEFGRDKVITGKTNNVTLVEKDGMYYRGVKVIGYTKDELTVSFDPIERVLKVNGEGKKKDFYNTETLEVFIKVPNDADEKNIDLVVENGVLLSNK